MHYLKSYNKNFNQIISEIKNLLKDDLNAINDTYNSILENEVSLIGHVSSHLLTADSKQLRPIMTLLTAKMFNYEGNKDIYLAAAVELIHTATILHDDVIDESQSRRNMNTANQVWGNNTSILVGDYLFSCAFRLMVVAKSLDILDVLANTSSIIAKGEVVQLANLNNIALKQDDYIKIIESKTAALFEAACLVGALLTKEHKANYNNIKMFARNLGCNFQIIDDMLDYQKENNKTGKTAGADFYEGKITLPIILLIKCCDNKDLKWLKKCFTQEQQYNPNSLELIIKKLEQYDIINQILAISEIYTNKAIDHLAKIPINNKYKDILIELTKSLQFRPY